MTNEYGSDSQPQEHEHEGQEATQETPAHEGEPGVWTDDQPPHDDFGSANEETATVSQEAATEAEAEEAPATEQRQSRSMLPVLAGLGGILLLGGIIYLQFGRSSPQPPPMHLTATPAAQKSAEPAPESSTQPTTSSATTNSAETDIGALYKPAGTPTPVTMPPSSTAIETTPSPLPSTSDTATGLPAPVAPPSSTTAQGSQTAVKSSVNPASGNPNAMAPTQPQSNPTNPVPPMPGQVLHPQPAMNTPSVAAVASNEHVDAQQLSRLNALTARIDVLQKSLDQVTNMVAAVPATTNHANSDVDNRLNRIEQTLTKIESDQAARGTRQVASSAVSESSGESPQVTHSIKSSSSKHKHHTKSASVSHHKPALTARTSGSHSQWVLRAATPKEAWVSTDPTSPDLRHIQIGESLPGIGVIRSIRQVNGGWEIEGSTGIIH